jgi:hypothetical protein
VVSATASDSHVRLALSDGTSRFVDHVMLGTGFSVDVSRYEFLGSLARSLDLINGYPALGDGFQSSVPGLHFVGAPAAWSFGPLMRFVSGTEFAGRTLMRSLGHGRVHQVSEDNSQWVALAKSQGQ